METVDSIPGFEFPMIRHARVQERPHRYVWGSDLTRLVRLDTLTDAVTHRALDGITLGEPIFVPHPQGSEMTVWHAGTLDIMARVTLPIAIPLGFHGAFGSG